MSSWTNLGNYIFGCSVPDGSIVYVYDNSGNIYKSLNSGLTFDNIHTFTTIGTIATMACNTSGSNIVIGGNLHAYYSTDSGNIWHQIDTGVASDGNWFYSDGSTTSLAIGQFVDISTDADLYNFNGSGWGVLLALSGAKSISFSDDDINNSICVAYGTVIYISTTNSISSTIDNLGFNWINAVQSITGQYKYCICTNNTNVYNVDQSGNVITINTFGIGTFTDIFCSNSGQYIAISSNLGQIYYSTNFGSSYTPYENYNNWQTIFTSDNGNVLFSSTLTPSLFQSTDGGISCLAFGTNILLNNGCEIPIQNLKIDDVVKTSSGEKKIIWMGWNCTNNYLNKFTCIKKNSFKYNVPNDDLFLSKGHSLFIEISDYNDELFLSKEFDWFYKLKHTIFNNYIRILASDFYFSSPITIKFEKFIFFHLVLESNDLDEQYIIYANNLEVETMSINHIQHSKLFTYVL